MTTEPDTPYRVTTSHLALSQLRALAAVAVARGLKDEYATALRAINDHLTRDPESWGDPLHRLAVPPLQILRGLHWGLAVFYGIDSAARVVVIREVRVLRGSALWQDPSNGVP
jgi:hypothetical protein